MKEQDKKEIINKDPPHVMIDEIRGLKRILHYIFILLLFTLFLLGLVRLVLFIISLF